MIKSLKIAVLGLTLLGFASSASALTFLLPIGTAIPAGAEVIFTGQPPTVVINYCDNVIPKVAMNLMILSKGQKPVNVDALVYTGDGLSFGDKVIGIVAYGGDSCGTSIGVYIPYSGSMR